MFYHALDIDEGNCIGCSRCLKVCPTEAIRITGGKVSATGGNGSAGIGGGYNPDGTTNGCCGDISITGGTVTAPAGAVLFMTSYDEDGRMAGTHRAVAPAEVSESARRKKARATSDDDTAPVAWTTLLSRLGTLVRNECALGPDERTRTVIRRETTPTPWQRRAYHLLADYPWPPVARTQ